MQQFRERRRVMVMFTLLVVLNEPIVLQFGPLLIATEGEVVPLGDL